MNKNNNIRIITINIDKYTISPTNKYANKIYSEN
jgi:hypothetical protein